MTKQHRYYEDLKNNQKGAWLCGELRIKLIIKNFIVATPEPDTGDDIWFSKSNKESYAIYPAQAKASFRIEFLRNDRIRRYRFTINPQRLEDSFKRHYFYFLGLYNPDIDNFQIGCLPSEFFLGHWAFLVANKLKPDGKRKKINIEVDYDLDNGKYFAFMKSVDITEYFQSWDEMVRQSI